MCVIILHKVATLIPKGSSEEDLLCFPVACAVDSGVAVIFSQTVLPSVLVCLSVRSWLYFTCNSFKFFCNSCDGFVGPQLLLFSVLVQSLFEACYKVVETMP